MEAHFGCVHVRFWRIGQLGCCFWVLFVRFCGIGQTCTGFGFCLSVSGESDTCGLGDGGLGGLGCGLGCHRRGYGCRIGVQRFDGTVDHFVDAAFDGDFHAVLFGGKRLKNGELAWQ